MPNYLRRVKDGRRTQGIDEKVVYSLTTTEWGPTPSNVAVVVKDASADLAVVTSTVMPTGTASVLGDVITLPKMEALTRGHLYRVEVKFDTGTNTLECYFEVQAEL